MVARIYMIVSDCHRLAYVHIPKCAGSSVRRALERYDDSWCYRFEPNTVRVYKHAFLGMLDFNHVPLEALHCHFPETYDKLLKYRCFAVCRSPFERFPSSLAQRLMMYKNRSIHHLSSNEVAREVEEVINYLSVKLHVEDPAYIHFERQVNFVFFKNKKIVSNLYRIEDLDKMGYRLFSRILRKEISFERNVGETADFTSKNLRYFVDSIKSPLQKILPKPIYSMVSEGARTRFQHRYDRQIPSGISVKNG